MRCLCGACAVLVLARARMCDTTCACVRACVRARVRACLCVGATPRVFFLSLFSSRSSFYSFVASLFAQVFLDLTGAIIDGKEEASGGRGGKKKKRNIVHGFLKLPKKIARAAKGGKF